LMAMLSINLGIFNLIPIPALDGGKILMNIIEAIRRKPLKQETETYITLVGVAIMVVLMIAVTWNDIMRAFF
ncbi:site-2 protease family protein, partial [Streptococcus pyogenes]